MKKLVILDKDKTLVQTVSGKDVSQHPEDQVLLPRVKERCQELKDAGYTLVIMSNQGGCSAINPETGKPYKTIDGVIHEMLFVMQPLEIDYAMFAPTFEDKYQGGEAIWLNRSGSKLVVQTIVNAKVKFRKPNPGMIDFIASFFEGRLWRDRVPVTCIGDRQEDLDAAIAASSELLTFQWANHWRQCGLQPFRPLVDEVVKQVDVCPYAFPAGTVTPWGRAARDIEIGDVVVSVVAGEKPKFDIDNWSPR